MAAAYRGHTLKTRLAATKVGQRHVAAVMGTNQPTISQLLNEAFPMPRGWSTKIAAAIQRIADGQHPHSKGCGCRRERLDDGSPTGE